VLSRQAPLRRRSARPAARSLSALALAAVLALAASGCGGDDSDDGAGAPDEAATSLEVTLDVDGSGAKETETADLSCPGADACATVDGIAAADFAQVPPTTACTEIFGGPEVVTIEGELDGEEVQATLTRANGCEIERFGTFIPLIKALFPDYQPGGELQP
jgi:hypothetical protein